MKHSVLCSLRAFFVAVLCLAFSQSIFAVESAVPCSTTTFSGGKVVPLSSSPVPAGNSSQFVVSNDFNNDGRRDLAAATQDGFIAVLLGDGNGNFGAPKRFATPSLGTYLAQGDFNNDGAVDLLVSMNSSPVGSVSLLFGDGAGNFQVANTLTVSSLPSGIQAGDFNGDDNQDFAVAQTGANSVAVFLGDGNGFFTAPVSYAVGVNAQDVSVKDFNGDGKHDLIVANFNSSFLSFLVGRGDGTFENAVQIPTPVFSSRSIDTGDFNSDGNIDLAVGTAGQRITVFTGNGAGTFTAQTPLVFTASPGRVRAADINNDGKLDLISSGGGSTSVNPFLGSSSVRLGNGDATFGNEIVFASGATPTSVTVEDFNTDGKQDLAISNLRSADISVLFGDGNGKFGATTYPTGGTQPVSSTTGDFNGDGKPDLAVANHQTKTISVFLNNGTGGFNAPIIITQTISPNVITTADVNRDGILDLMTGNAGNSNNNATLFSHLGNGDGTFGPGLAGSTTTARQFHSIAVANITDDDVPDLVLAGTESDGRLLIFNGNTSGFFTFYQQMPLDSPVLHVTAGDFNGDGRTDVAATTTRVALLLNNETRRLDPPTYFEGGFNTSFLAPGDFNEDGVLDLAVANDTFAGDVAILLGNGKAGFHPPTRFAAGNGPSSIVVRDFNDDQNLDLAVSNPGGNQLGENKISVLFGDGTGAFTRPNEFIAGQNPRNIVSADFNGDGLPDLATPNYNGADVSILYNSCFQPAVITQPSVSLSNDVTLTEVEGSTVNASFTVTLSAASTRAVRVNYYTSAQTATGTTDYQPVAGTLVFQPNETSKTITVPVKDDATDEFDETFKVFLTNPVNATLNDAQATVTIIDNDASPTISISDATVVEGNTGTTNIVFTVTASAASDKPIVVQFATNSGTATSGIDFVRTTGLLTIPARSTTGTISVPVNGDFAIEPDETFTLNLSNPVNATIADGQGTGTITNDDAGGTIQFSAANYNVNEEAVTATFTVTRTGGTASGATVQYTTASGTAISNQDFRAAAGTLTFGAGETSKTFTVVIINDLIDEPDETGNLVLSNPTGGATLGTPSTATFTIIDNDSVPDVTINDVTLSEGNSGTTNATFTVKLSASSGRTITVNYATANGTATAGSDYTATSGTLTFAPSSLLKTVTVPVIGDTVYEPNEDFTVILSNAVNANITDGEGRGTIVNDEANPDGRIELVSVNRFGTGSGNDGAISPSITPDGRFVAFSSVASNLVPNDTNTTVSDVYVRDTQTDTTILVSVNRNNNGTGNGNSNIPFITPDARFVLFQSIADDLTTVSDTNTFFDVFLRDLQTGTTTLVSINAAGNAAGNGSSHPVAVTPNGRYVVFRSTAANLSPLTDLIGREHVFVRDMQTGTTQLISVNAAGTAAGNSTATGVYPNSISADGRFVLFMSEASDLQTTVPDTFNSRDIFMRDRQNNVTVPVNVNRTATALVNFSQTPTMSSDGRYVTFSSFSADVVEGDTNNTTDVFVRDMQAGTNLLVSRNLAGTSSGNAPSEFGRITANGRFVAFTSYASNLTADTDTNQTIDVFVRDLQTNTTRFGSLRSDNTNSGNAFSRNPTVTPDGRFIVFESLASDLVTTVPDNNSAFDVFVRDLQTRVTNLVSINDFGTAPGNLSSGASMISDDGKFVIFQSPATNLVVNDNNNSDDIFKYRNTVARRTPIDFDGDGKSDLGVFRPSDGTWYLLRSQAGFTGLQFGISTDTPVAADYDGDGKADVAVFRSGTWYITLSTNNSLRVNQFGASGDVPSPRDFDGDGKADLAVFRPADGTWYILQSSNGEFRGQQFGANGDLPVAADFDGDAKADLAVFRPSSGGWYIILSSNNSLRVENFGINLDKPVPGDFDGDGKADVAVFRPSDGAWYILQSSSGTLRATQFGANGDVPVVGDYDGDGKIDLTVFRSGNWYILSSVDGSFRAVPFGQAGDKPVSAANLF